MSSRRRASRNANLVDRAKAVLVRRRMRYSPFASPSKYSTVSTRCSSRRGPAMAPSLVTCPTINVAQPRALGILHQRLRAIANLRDAARIGFRFRQPDGLDRVDDQCERSVLLRIDRAPRADSFRDRPSSAGSAEGSVRSARSFTCAADSSPQTYTTSPLRASRAAICSINVDLPAPGGPPTSVKLPGRFRRLAPRRTPACRSAGARRRSSRSRASATGTASCATAGLARARSRRDCEGRSSNEFQLGIADSVRATAAIQSRRRSKNRPTAPWPRVRASAGSLVRLGEPERR